MTGNEISDDHVFILSTVIKWLQRMTIAFLEWILKTTGAKAKTKMLIVADHYQLTTINCPGESSLNIGT